MARVEICSNIDIVNAEKMCGLQPSQVPRFPRISL
jgi:hypothetical protein